MDANLLTFFFAGDFGPPIEFVGAESADASTVTIPAGHRAGDLIVMVGWQEGSGAPTAPGGEGWEVNTSASRTGFGAKNFRTYTKRATGGSETSGTWSTVDSLHCHVYRNASGIGAIDRGNSGSSKPFVTSLSLQAPKTSWVMAFAANLDDLNMTDGSSQLTERTLEDDTSAPDKFQAETWDTNGPVESFSSTGSMTSVDTDWVALVMEILKA